MMAGEDKNNRKYTHTRPYTFIASSVDHVFHYPTEDTQVWFSPANRGQNVPFLCKIAFLHANMTHHWAMRGMISQREERTYLSNAFYVISKSLPISDDRGPSSIEGMSTVWRLKFINVSSIGSINKRTPPHIRYAFKARICG